MAFRKLGKYAKRTVAVGAATVTLAGIGAVTVAEDVVHGVSGALSGIGAQSPDPQINAVIHGVITPSTVSKFPLLVLENRGTISGVEIDTTNLSASTIIKAVNDIAANNKPGETPAIATITLKGGNTLANINSVEFVGPASKLPKHGKLEVFADTTTYTIYPDGTIHVPPQTTSPTSQAPGTAVTHATATPTSSKVRTP